MDIDICLVLSYLVSVGIWIFIKKLFDGAFKTTQRKCFRDWVGPDALFFLRNDECSNEVMTQQKHFQAKIYLLIS